MFASASSRTAYLDGTAGTENTTTVGTFDASDTYSIGAWEWVGATIRYMDGQIGEVGMWNVALTAAEILVLAAGYSPLLVRPESLVSYVPLVNNDPYQDHFDNAAFTVGGTPDTAAHPPIIKPTGQIFRFPSGPTIDAVSTDDILRLTENPWAVDGQRFGVR